MDGQVATVLAQPGTGARRAARSSTIFRDRYVFPSDAPTAGMQRIPTPTANRLARSSECNGSRSPNALRNLNSTLDRNRTRRSNKAVKRNHHEEHEVHKGPNPSCFLSNPSWLFVSFVVMNSPWDGHEYAD